MIWMLLTLLYGVTKGVREIVKKKSLEKSTVAQVLFFYSLLGFLMLFPDIKNITGVEANKMLYIAIKSFIIFIAWIASFHAIKKIPISLYGILDLSRVLFATLLGVVVLNEQLKFNQFIGLFCVATGLLMLKFRGNIKFLNKKDASKKDNTEENVKWYYVFFAFLSCLLNAISGLMDKILTKDKFITPSQLQFWYMFFLVVFYFIYLVVEAFIINQKKLKNDQGEKGLGWLVKVVDWKGVITNYWIWILSILFIIADRALFVANAYPDSRVTVMTLIKQSGCLVTILAGKFIFKEKHIRYKLLCAFIIILGIIIGVL